MPWICPQPRPRLRTRITHYVLAGPAGAVLGGGLFPVLTQRSGLVPGRCPQGRPSLGLTSEVECDLGGPAPCCPSRAPWGEGRAWPTRCRRCWTRQGQLVAVRTRAQRKVLLSLGVRLCLCFLESLPGSQASRSAVLGDFPLSSCHLSGPPFRWPLTHAPGSAVWARGPSYRVAASGATSQGLPARPPGPTSRWTNVSQQMATLQTCGPRRGRSQAEARWLPVAHQVSGRTQPQRDPEAPAELPACPASPGRGRGRAGYW